MSEPKYTIQWVGDMFGMLVDDRGRSPLEKSLKKEESSKYLLFKTIEKIESLGYEDGVEFAFGTQLFKTVKYSYLNLIEIRKLNKTWRVITYWDKEKEKFVMLNAFEAHKHKKLEKYAKEQKELIYAARELLGKE